MINYVLANNILLIFIVSNAQSIDFLNSVFLPCDPFNNEIYDNKRILTKEILSFVWKYSSIHDSKSISTFGKWMKNNKLHLLECPIKRVYDNENSKIQTRNLYVLKDKFINDNLDNIVNYMPKYKVQLQQFKNDGYTIIGYARKPKGPEAEETRKKLLQLMCNNLRNRSLTDHIFISYQCQANDLIYERDKIRNQNILEELSVDGDTNDMIEFISIKKKVCIVALDYSGLSTNHLDLQEFIRNNASIKKIIIDTLPFNNKVKIYDRDQLLNYQDIMMQFDCRTKCLQRSK
ncbi:unnamed protein product [Cunninghamella echinulata]